MERLALAVDTHTLFVVQELTYMHQFVRSVKYKVLNHYQQLQPETLHI